MFQNPPDLVYSLLKAMVMATTIVLVGCYYGYNASGGAGGGGGGAAEAGGGEKGLVRLRLHPQRRAGRRGDGDGEVDGAEHRARAPHRDARHAAVLGGQSASADRRGDGEGGVPGELWGAAEESGRG